METSISVANHDVFHSQINGRNLGPKETSNCDANHSVLHAQNDR